MKQLKTWEKPNLLVLTSNKFGENILNGCKNGDSSSANGEDTACLYSMGTCTSNCSTSSI